MSGAFRTFLNAAKRFAGRTSPGMVVAAAAASTSVVYAAHSTVSPLPFMRRFNMNALSAQAAACQGPTRHPATKSSISRVMLPDDANPAGNVHGGTILRMVDECGFIAATRYANQAAGEECVAALARIEHMDFLRPMFIGNVGMKLAAPSPDSPADFPSQSEQRLVAWLNPGQVCVWADNPLTGEKVLTNKARCWYIATSYSAVKNKAKKPLGGRSQFKVLKLEPMKYDSEEAEAAGRERYEKQKARRTSAVRETVPKNIHQLRASLAKSTSNNGSSKTPSDSESSLVQLMMPSDCSNAGVAMAGAVMKLMDNVAGIVAVRHCRSNVVTASLDAMDFTSPVFNANLVHLVARPVFTSSRSIDIEVQVFAEDLSGEIVLSNSSNFTFVSLDSYYRPKKMPVLTPESEEEKAKFQNRLENYTERKSRRIAKIADGFCCELP